MIFLSCGPLLPETDREKHMVARFYSINSLLELFLN